MDLKGHLLHIALLFDISIVYIYVVGCEGVEQGTAGQGRSGQEMRPG